MVGGVCGKETKMAKWQNFDGVKWWWNLSRLKVDVNSYATS